jgi:hypothetical protein
MNPIDIKYVDISTLVVPEWRATYILRPDLMVLSASLQEFGFIQPIHVRRGTNEIIDGSERWLLATNVKSIMNKIEGKIPVVEHELDSLESMMLHLRLNRGRGSLVAKPMSRVIRKLYISKKYDRKDFENLLCMKTDEADLMLDGGIIKARKIHEHTYARAWVPIEAPSGTVDREPTIERPPNKDR